MTDFTMHSHQPISCAQVESLASEWVDGALASDVRAAIEAHLDGCESCANLVADLAAIAGEARALPRLEPARDLWTGIAARIETPVVALEPRRVVVVSSHRWWKSAVAAAALVAVTAGVTWRVAVRSVADETIAAGAPARASSPDAPATGSAQVAATSTAPDSGPATGAATPPATTPAAARVAVREPRAGGGARAVPGGTRRPASAASSVAAPVLASAAAPLAPLPVAAQAYDREIEGMRALVTERRKDLDPTTVRVLERNLKIIDQAIAESRAALVQDPASGLLAEQLTRAMKRKLELLRTAAGLPARIS